jgi:hypothetical protein
MKLFKRENIIVAIDAMMQMILRVVRGIQFHMLVIDSFLITWRLLRQSKTS